MSVLNSVNFLDLKRLNSQHRDELIAAATRVIDSGWYILGEEVSQFEDSFAKYCGAKHCVGVGNGLDALVLILKGYIELGRLSIGDKVLIPGNTFIATALAVSQAGLEPVLQTPDENTYNIVANQIDHQVIDKVTAIIGVHLYGQLADVLALRDLCDQHNILFIEDAAQSHGAEIQGQKAGVFGHAAGFSCFPGKNLGALGDAGVIVTNDDDLSVICKSLRNYGSKVKYEHEFKGVNSRLDEMQAAFLGVKLKYLNQDIERRRSIASRYLTEISNHIIKLPFVTSMESHVWHLFVVRSSLRDELQAYLGSQNIQTLIHYPKAISNQGAYKGALQHCEASIAMSNEILSLPVDPSMSSYEVSQVINACNNFKVNE